MKSLAFHLALPVHDLAEARRFYGEALGCVEGRSAPRWVDFDFFGHQLSLHLSPLAKPDHSATPVDGDHVPVPHFGAVLSWSDWERLCERLAALQLPSVIGPRVRFAGLAGEQGTVFVRDPSGHMLEFKGFKDPSAVFQVDDERED